MTGWSRAAFWMPELDELIRSGESAVKLAKLLKISQQTINRRRRKLGVEVASPRRVEWTIEMLEELRSNLTNKELGLRFGVTDVTVRKKRLRLGLETNHHPDKITWTPEMDDMILNGKPGVMGKNLPHILGVAGTTIYKRRKTLQADASR